MVGFAKFAFWTIIVVGMIASAGTLPLMFFIVWAIVCAVRMKKWPVKDEHLPFDQRAMNWAKKEDRNRKRRERYAQKKVERTKERFEQKQEEKGLVDFDDEEFDD